MRLPISFLLTSLLVLLHCSLSAAAMVAPKQIQWQTDYQAALNQAKAANKPLLLFFTGSDWCPACKRLEAEALHTPEFADLVGSRFIFVKLDQPNDPAALSPALATQNKALRRKYDIRVYPTVILLDASNERQIGSTGYRPGGAREYAKHLLRMVDTVGSYQKRMAEVGQSALTTAELEHLYQQARHFHFEHDAHQILKAALAAPCPSAYFLTERYRILAQDGQIRSSEAQLIKRRILSQECNNPQHSHLQVAVIEFETYCGDSEHHSGKAEVAVAPLVEYLDRFSQQDRDSAWRLPMLISQVFLDNDQMNKALKYAQTSYEQAPPAARGDIALTIQNIQANLHP